MPFFNENLNTTNENDLFIIYSKAKEMIVFSNKERPYTWYITFDKIQNHLVINILILILPKEDEICLKKHIKFVIEKYNAKIHLYDFGKNQINKLPNWLKDLIIL